MAVMTNDRIAALAKIYQPYLLFDPMERSFPAVAEEWLNHRSSERWDKKPTHERGTAVLLVPSGKRNFSSADVRAGSDAPEGGPLQLNTVRPNGIGQQFDFDPSLQDLFLDCAGWDDTPSEVGPGDPTFTSGSIHYLSKLFSGLANAMNNAVPREVPNPAPKFDLARSTSPTSYVEIEWAGRYPRLDQARVKAMGGAPDFPASIGDMNQAAPRLITALDSYIVFNYYLFYPMMEPSPVAQPTPDARNREGQWEAISVFIKGDADFEHRDADGRPDFSGIGPGEQLVELPAFVVYSQGYALGDDNSSPLAAEVRPWSDPLNRSSMSVTAIDAHPVAYVTAGTHKNLFAIAATQTTGQSQPDPALNTTGAAVMGAAGSAAGICAGISGLPPAAIACLVIAGVLFLVGLILFLLSFFLRSDPVTESPQSSAAGTDVARDGGPASVPAGAQGPPSPPGLPPSSVVDTTLRFVSRFRFDPTPPVTKYPLPEPGVFEMPTWWLFPGRWGVRVMNRASSQWDSGTRRVDSFERSRGYWNAYQLVAFLGAPERAQDGIRA